MKNIFALFILILAFSTLKAQDTTRKKNLKSDTISAPANNDRSGDDSNPGMRYNTKGSKIEYNGVALNTNFILPIIRFNYLNTATDNNEKGSLEYFNSAGAGFGLSFGRVKVEGKNDTEITDNSLSDDIDIEMSNYFGINIGFLFSKNDIDSVHRMIFAPTISLQLLDFQFAYGYELGTVTDAKSRSFFTVSYGIPIQKLTNTGSLLLKNFKPKNSSNQKGGVFLF